MGAGQSTPGGRDSTSAAIPEVKQSYYELLGVDRQATDEEIKKAYRRKALELHPDRNYGDTERTTALFSAVQSAYEVLSDPHERAWYDSHEESILRDLDPADGDDPQAYEHNVGLTTADDIARLVRRFNGSVEFSDAPSGFYGFLRDFFATLAKEEEHAALRNGGAVPDYPSFGHADDDYEDAVRGFYARWGGFSTRKTFAWRDRYRASEAEERRVRRAIDKENARLRREGAAEFNDAVRTLVAFVRKRDPRYTPNTQSEAERVQVLRDAAAAQAARMRAANAAKLADVELPAWTQAPRDKDPLAEFEGEVEADESSEEEHFECVACRKTFKSEGQWSAHEKSKKHVKAIAALRRKMQKEGNSLGLDDDDDQGDAPDEDAAAPEDDAAGDAALDDRSHDAAIDDLTSATQNLQTSHTSSPPSRSPSASPSSTSSHDSLPTTPPAHTLNTTTSTSDSESDSNAPTTTSTTTTAKAPKQGKAKQKRARRAAAAAAQDSETRYTCATCAATFASRSRLFQHLQDHGHMAPVVVNEQKGGGGGEKKKKGRRR